METGVVTGDANSDANASPEIARVTLKLPPFWRKNVKVWFLQVESQFVTSRITAEITKYHYVLGTLDSEVAELVTDLISRPLSKQPYSDLKNRLVEEFEESEGRKVKKLLTELELGNDKPTALLRHMRSLAGDKVSDEFLRTMFIQRLPSYVQPVLACSKDSLDNIANMADKIVDMNPSVGAITAQTGSPNLIRGSTPSAEVIERIEGQVAALTRAVQKLTMRNRSRSSSTNRGRSLSNPRYDTCWYHFKFKDQARKCVQPCNYKKSTEN